MKRPNLYPRLTRPQPLCRLKSTDSSGFTLIEMLVVIVIMAILAAIAFPAFLGQVRRAQETEALTYMGSINRAQQAYRLDSPTFANSIEKLGIGLLTDTSLYQYSVLQGSSLVAVSAAIPQDVSLKGFTGIVYVHIGPHGTATTTSKLCHGDPTHSLAPSVAVSGTQVSISSCDDI
ncbi:type IV pilin-like G/H family protein [Pseudanabaena sp. FACHB-2040]|uniref:type IV pilin protein n=1 Tax=Pseudanabaena sp. FACHB-2040 TaxID=2692859 RepID=UPI001685B9A8|nr:type IV pilin-like G/H family protein [Pseudanabaena sp. FACHB-2040]MBD2260992.1 prepilin-type N-terminal cleavage/methylation domain-containing protein [Pseudanabaena sp. FACHB-2040]